MPAWSTKASSFEEAHAARVAQRSCSPRIRRCRPGHDRFLPIWSKSTWARCATHWDCRYDELMGLGRVDPDNPGEDFCMTVLALKMSRRANAVSVAARRVSRAMWHALWPDGWRKSADRPHHQRRARSLLAGAADAPASTTGIWGPTGRNAAETGGLGTAIETYRRRRAVGNAPDAQGAPARFRAPPRSPHRHSAAANRPETDRPAAPCTEPRRPDHRLRPPVRHLQARQPVTGRPRAAGRRWSTIRRCRSSSSSPARPIRRTAGQAASCSGSPG